MATRTFADLSPYRRAVSNAQAGTNLLDSLIQGVQGGIQLGRLPQTLQDQRIAQELQNAINQQKLFDMQNPEAAMARELQKFAQTTALKEAITNPNSGIIQTPAGLVGETIAVPSAIPQTAISLDQAIAANPNLAIPAAAPRLPITPIGVGPIQSGLSIDQNVPVQAEETKLAQDMRRDAARRSTTAATRNLQFRDVGNAIVSLDPTTGAEVSRIEKDVNERLINTSNGPFVYDPRKPREGRYVGGGSATSTGAGLKPTGEETKAFRTTINVFSGLDDIEKKADELQKTGKFPGSGQAFISQALSQKPSDIPGAGLIPGASAAYAAIQQKLRAAQTPESRQYEAMRAELTSQIIRAQAGLSQTSGEVENVIPYTPQVSDTIESLRDKLTNLKRIAQRDLGSFQLLYPAFREVQIPGFTNQQAPPPELSPALNGQIVPQINRLSSSENFPNEQAARAAGFQDGDAVIVDGGTYILTP